MRTKKGSSGADNRHREKKSRNTRGIVRSEIQVPRGETGNSRRKSNRSGVGDPRSPRHDTSDDRKKKRPDPELGDGDNRVTDRNHSLVSNKLRSKISEDQATRILERMAREQFLDNPNAIFRIGEDVRAFGRYLIHPCRDGFQIFRGATLAAETDSSRVAISWCIADKLNKHELSQQMIWADQEVSWRTKEIQHYRYVLAVSQDTTKKYVIADRLNDAQTKLRYAQDRLDKCLNLAKYWQHKGFNNETARTGIKN